MPFIFMEVYLWKRNIKLLYYCYAWLLLFSVGMYVDGCTPAQLQSRI